MLSSISKKPEQAASSTLTQASKKGRKRKASTLTIPTPAVPQTQASPKLLPPITPIDKIINANDLVQKTGDNVLGLPEADLEIQQQQQQLNSIPLIVDNNQQSTAIAYSPNNHQNVSMIGSTSVIVNPVVESNLSLSIHDDINEVPTHVAAEECVPMEYSN